MLLPNVLTRLERRSFAVILTATELKTSNQMGY